MLHHLWTLLDGDPDLVDGVRFEGPDQVLPSVFDVTGFASATVGAACLAVAELWSVRTGAAVAPVTVDRRLASAAFLRELLFAPDGWERPAVWDPIAGDYEAADGWIRLHTNYRHHRDAALSVLGVAPDRDLVAATVARWAGDDLEQAVVDAGGCAAALRTAEAWRAHPAGVATAGEPPIALGAPVPSPGLSLAPPATERPLSGVRVLDLTRVIAGPVATGFLAAYGADVLRIDPPGFDEVGALLPETTAGKRSAFLDLRATADRTRFEELVADAHLVVAGLRPGAMDGLGLGTERLRTINPALITVHHDAYGWAGPWAGRRGFDSLVQMSTGIAAAGMAASGSDRPRPLPAQALDHGTGHLLAAAACRALTRLLQSGEAGDVRGSLVGAANAVQSHPTPDGLDAPPPDWSDAARQQASTWWGPGRRVPVPGQVGDVAARWTFDAGPLGRHEPSFLPAS